MRTVDTLFILVLCSLAPCASSLRLIKMSQTEEMMQSPALVEDISGKQNLCVDHHLVPEFFILGAQKAGTTALAHALSGHPGIVQPKVLEGESKYFEKEPHIFENMNDEDNNWGPHRYNKDLWLSRYPSCTRATRRVAVDETPNYLTQAEVPPRIKAFYGVQADTVIDK